MFEVLKSAHAGAGELQRAGSVCAAPLLLQRLCQIGSLRKKHVASIDCKLLQRNDFLPLFHARNTVAEANAPGVALVGPSRCGIVNRRQKKSGRYDRPLKTSSSESIQSTSNVCSSTGTVTVIVPAMPWPGAPWISQ